VGSARIPEPRHEYPHYPGIGAEHLIKEAHVYHLGEAETVQTNAVGWARDALWDPILDVRRGRRRSGRVLALRLAGVLTQPKSQVVYLTSRIVCTTMREVLYQ
jgi:hypothetical protein